MASHLLRFDSPAGRMLSVPLGYAYCSKNGKASAGRPARAVLMSKYSDSIESIGTVIR